jgi:hypothetical protein
MAHVEVRDRELILYQTLIGSGAIRTTLALSTLWVVVAIPVTVVVVGLLCVICCFPGLTLGYRAMMYYIMGTKRRHGKHQMKGE